MNEFIELTDGTQVFNAYIVQLEEKIAVYINEHTDFSELYELFGDPKKTVRMHSFQYGDEKDWTGYTKPYAMEERDESAMVCLKKVKEEEVNA